MRTKIIAGNWKMNKTPDEAKELAAGIRIALDGFDDVEVVICPTFVALGAASVALAGSRIGLGAQNMNAAQSGAFTGEVSAGMLLAAGVKYVILGHSERRTLYGETDTDVNAKAKAALAAGLVPIVCVGETLEERENDQTEEVIVKQVKDSLDDIGEDLERCVIAYEPVWAIGTGRTATPGQAQEVHALIRRTLAEMVEGKVANQIRIQYGGSMNPGNAAELLAQPDIDGGLIGGAALAADSFVAIVRACV